MKTMYSKEEIENLNRLLSSSETENISLGIELLQQFPQQAIDCIYSLVLLEAFCPYSISIEVSTLLSTQIERKALEQYRQHLQVFRTVAEHKALRWSDFFTQLQFFEKNRHHYEPFILTNSIYIQKYVAISQYIRNKYKKAPAGYYYLQTAIDSGLTSNNDNNHYINTMLNDIFDLELHLDKIPQVIEIAEKMAVLYPNYSAQYYYLAGIIYDVYANDKDNAENFYYKCLAIDPKHSDALNNLANILFKVRGDKEKAKALVLESIALNGEDVHNVDTLAFIELKGFYNLEEAERLFRKAVQLKRNHHASLTGLGEVLEAKGQYQEALQWYQKGLKIRPQSEYKQQKLQELIEKIKDKGGES